jgi:hypothetical protein
MIDYLAKLEEVAEAIEAKRGPFALFGLFMREDSPRLWDIVVSAPWMEEGRVTALREFVEVLTNAFGREAMLSFSRIVTLNRGEPTLDAILGEVGEAPLPVSKQGHNLFGLPVKEPSGKQHQRMSGRHCSRSAARR